MMDPKIPEDDKKPIPFEPDRDEELDYMTDHVWINAYARDYLGEEWGE